MIKICSLSLTACNSHPIVSHLLWIKSDYSHRFRFPYKFGCNKSREERGGGRLITVWPHLLLDYHSSRSLGFQPASLASAAAHGKCVLLWKLEPIQNIEHRKNGIYDNFTSFYFFWVIIDDIVTSECMLTMLELWDRKAAGSQPGRQNVLLDDG